MSWKLTCLLVLASLCATDPALAQQHRDVQPRYSRGHEDAPRGALYLGGYSRDGAEGQVVVDFYTRQDPALTNDGVRFGAIPFARRGLDRGDGAPAVLGWADGRTCGQLGGVLMEYARLVPPTFQLPYLYQAPPARSSAMSGPPARLHPVNSSVWGRARQADGGPAFLTITGADGLIDQWTAFAEAQLADCWSPGEPSGLRE